MFCADVFDKEKETHSYNFHILSTWGCNTFEELKDRDNKFVRFIPCWSLASLLEQLPYEVYDDAGNSVYLKIDKEGDVYQLAYIDTYGFTGNIYTDMHEHFADACYEMIIHLDELKML